MSKYAFVVCTLFACVLILLLDSSAAIPRPQQPVVGGRQSSVASSEAEDLSTGAENVNEKDDLQGSASAGYGYYSYPYLSNYYGGYYPSYSGYGYGLGYGLGYGWGLGDPYYGGGYYGGYHGHGHHGHFF